MTVKHFLLTLTFLMSVFMLCAQSDVGFSYQAVARDPGGSPLINQAVSIEFVIRKTQPAGLVIYQESHQLTTNQFGLFTTSIGDGMPILGAWNQISWNDGDHYLEVLLNGVSVSVTRFEAVPYAKISTDMRSTDLVDVGAVLPQLGEVMKWNGTEWVPGTDSQGAVYSAGTGISISAGQIQNTAPDLPVTITGSGATTVSGSYPTFTISSTDLVNDADADPNNEIQTLSLSGTDLSLSNGGGFVTIPQTIYSAGQGISIAGTQINNTGDLDDSDDLTLGSLASGDLNGTYPNPTVKRIRGITVANGTPQNGQMLTYNGSQWGFQFPPESPWQQASNHVYYTQGNAGVGITTPVDRLHLHTNSSSTSSFRMTNQTTGTSNADGFWLGYSGVNAAYVYNFESSPLIFGTNNSEMMRLTTTGDLGLGTLNPAGKVEIVDDASQNVPHLTLREISSNDYARIQFRNGSGNGFWAVEGKPASVASNSQFQIRHNTQGAMLVLGPNKRVGLLTSAPSADLHIKQNSSLWTNGGGLVFEENGSSSDTWQMLHTGLHFSYVENGVRRAYIETATGNWVQPSDMRLKQDVTQFPQVLDRMSQITPVMYRYNDQASGPLTIGFLAQEVVEVFPELRHESEDGFLGLTYTDFGILAVKAIQEQQQIIEAQSDQIENLQQRVDMLTEMVQQIQEQLDDGE